MTGAAILSAVSTDRSTLPSWKNISGGFIWVVSTTWPAAREVLGDVDAVRGLSSEHERHGTWATPRPSA